MSILDCRIRGRNFGSGVLSDMYTLYSLTDRCSFLSPICSVYLFDHVAAARQTCRTVLVARLLGVYILVFKIGVLCICTYIARREKFRPKEAGICTSSPNPLDILVMFQYLCISLPLSHFASIPRTFLEDSEPNPGIIESKWLDK
jgi:hypothetical protein